MSIEQGLRQNHPISYLFMKITDMAQKPTFFSGYNRGWFYDCPTRIVLVPGQVLFS
jgi:hypothetical protein